MTQQPDSHLVIEGKRISLDEPTYFIADIAANHDGDSSAPLSSIHLAAEAGADAAKFQHFEADTIVSDAGFRSLGEQQSHQASWKKSVFEVYQDASIDLGWTPDLKEGVRRSGHHIYHESLRGRSRGRRGPVFAGVQDRLGRHHVARDHRAHREQAEALHSRERRVHDGRRAACSGDGP